MQISVRNDLLKGLLILDFGLNVALRVKKALQAIELAYVECENFYYVLVLNTWIEN